MKQKLTKRQQQALETRNTIYNAAITLLNEEGFENITISDISERAGVSVGAFYHHFETKYDILGEIFRKGDQYFLENVADKLTAPTAKDRIVEYFEHYARYNILTTVNMTRQLFNAKVKFFVVKDRPMHSILERVIREGVESGEILCGKDPEEIVRMLFIFARGIVFNWSLLDGEYNLEETMRNYIRLLVVTL